MGVRVCGWVGDGEGKIVGGGWGSVLDRVRFSECVMLRGCGCGKGLER